MSNVDRGEETDEIIYTRNGEIKGVDRQRIDK
jgi:hypothetical protein